MAMPEAAMDEDGELAAGQDDVGPAGQVLAMKPKADAESVQEAADRAFRRRILAAHGGHDAGALGRGHAVHSSFRRRMRRKAARCQPDQEDGFLLRALTE
jgi:hypothetical protein